MVFLNMSCDQMSRDHLRYDHQMMRHRDMNRMDGMNLDGKMKIHHVNHRMKVCRMRLNRASYLVTEDRLRNLKGHCVDLKIDPVCYVSYYPHDLLDVSLNY
jgi:hypothetical protein